MRIHSRMSKNYVIKYCNNCTYDIFLSCPYKNGVDCHRLGSFTPHVIHQKEINYLIEVGLYTKEEIDKILTLRYENRKGVWYEIQDIQAH